MLVGSNVFFKDIEGFTSKDIDILEFVDNPTDFKNVRQFKFPDKCVFQWRKMPIDELIDITLSRNFPMEIGKFLVPEFIKEFKLSIDDLKRLKPIITKLDDKHKYEEVIYNAYIENNDFILTDKQRQDAFETYTMYRNINKVKK